MLFDTSVVIIQRPKPPRRKIYLCKRADVNGIKEDIRNLTDDIQREREINLAWDRLKGTIFKAIDKRVPSKMSTSRHTNPWMNTEIKRTIRRKQRTHQKARRINRKRDNDRYKRLQKDVQFQIRRTNRDYLENTVSNNCRVNSKKFWAFVRRKIPYQ